MPGRKPLVAEFLGTFILVFAGTGAAVVNQVSNGTVSHVGVALTFGLVVLTVIYAIGDVSGAHINPAVTLGFCVSRRFPWSSLLPYVGVQCLGALAASATLHYLFPANETLGATLPAGPPMQSFVLELIFTGVLMFVVLNVSQGAKERGITAGLVIGSVIAWEAMMGGPVSGASMNPARSLGPAVVSHHLESLWLYWAAPCLGAICGVIACHLVRTGESIKSTSPAPSPAPAPQAKARHRRK
jgi:aquaporin Z